MKTAKRLSCLLLAAVVLLLCAGCGASEPPPDFEAVSKVFRENKSDFLLIAAYLSDAGGDCVIDETDGTFRRKAYDSYAYDEAQIDDPRVEAAVERLLVGQKIKKIYKKTDTVLFYLWGNAIPPSECGVAFRIVRPEDEADAPEGDAEAPDKDADAGPGEDADAGDPARLNTGYLARQEPLPEQDWYYYLSDYNEWRNG